MVIVCLFTYPIFNSCTPSDDDFLPSIGEVNDNPPDDNPPDDNSDDDNSDDDNSDDDNSDDGEDVETNQTLTAYFRDNPEYSILSTAIEQIGFSAALDNPSSYTFFAPDNSAFTRYLESLGINDVRNISTGLLTQIIQYHMLSGRRDRSDFTTGYTMALAREFASQGNVNMYIAKNENTIRINNTVEIIGGNIQATNGTILKVSEVIALPTIATFIQSDPQFAELATVINRETDNKVFELLGLLDRDFTLLAPNNTAFNEVLTELEYPNIDAVPEAELVNILENHIHPNSIKRQNKLTDNLMMVMKNENNVTVTNADGIEFLDENQRNSKLLTANIQAWNGVIHIVDKVLLPR